MPRRETHGHRDDLGLIVQNPFRRHFVVGDGERQSGATADDDAQSRADISVSSRARSLRDQNALPHLFVGADLRQSTPVAVRKMHRLVGDDLFRLLLTGGFGFGRDRGSHASHRTDHRRLKPGFCAQHRPRRGDYSEGRRRLERAKPDPEELPSAGTICLRHRAISNSKRRVVRCREKSHTTFTTTTGANTGRSRMGRNRDRIGGGG
jgi:hypothetical protein